MGNFLDDYYDYVASVEALGLTVDALNVDVVITEGVEPGSVLMCTMGNTLKWVNVGNNDGKLP